MPGKLICSVSTGDTEKEIYIPFEAKPRAYYLVLMKRMYSNSEISNIYMAIGGFANDSLKNIFYMILNNDNFITAIGYSENGHYLQINRSIEAWMNISVYELFT